MKLFKKISLTSASALAVLVLCIGLPGSNGGTGASQGAASAPKPNITSEQLVAYLFPELATSPDYAGLLPDAAKQAKQAAKLLKQVK